MFKCLGAASPWNTWMSSPNLMAATLPEGINESVNLFQRLILVKALREVIRRNFVVKTLVISM